MTTDVDEFLRQDPATTRDLQSALDRVPGLRKRERHLVETGPVDGAPALAVRAAPSGRYAEIFAVQFCVVAGDNLETWHDVLYAGKQPAYGHLSLLRSGYEAATSARWLLDPSLTLAERVARGVAAQARDWGERARFEAAGEPKHPARPRPERGKTGEERLADLEAERDANGIRRVEMNSVDAAARYVVGAPNGGKVYRLLSAFAHGTMWSLLASDMAVLMSGNQPPQSHLGMVTARGDVAAGLTFIVVRTYAAALDDLATYFDR